MKIKNMKVKLKIKSKLTPEINTVAPQLMTKRIVCPRSGWSINKIVTANNNKKLKKYFVCEFLKISRINIFAVTKIKKGFNNSIGCNLKK